MKYHTYLAVLLSLFFVFSVEAADKPLKVVEDVVIRNVDLKMHGGVTEWSGKVKEDEKGYPDAMFFSFRRGLPAYGFWIRHARGIFLDNVTVTPVRPDARPLFAVDINVSDVIVNGKVLAEK